MRKHLSDVCEYISVILRCFALVAKQTSLPDSSIMIRSEFVFIVLAVICSTSLATVLICDRPNEEYQCGSACQTTCATLGQTCPIVNIKCNDDCYCKEGYARDCRDRCIPIKSCPGRGCKSRKRYHPKDTSYLPRGFGMTHPV